MGPQLYPLLLLAMVQGSDAAYGRRLGAYVRHYEPLRYNAAALQRQHERARRSLSGVHQPISIDFHALGRHFSLRLVRDVSLFSEDFSVQHGAREPEPYAPSHIYTGNIHGEEGSLVHASVSDGQMEGFIVTRGGGTYYMEPASRHLLDSSSAGRRGFDHQEDVGSIIYHEDDLHYPHPYGALGGCADHSVFHKMQILQRDGQAVNTSADATAAHREKRALGPDQTTCLLYIQTDHLFTQHYGSRDNVIAQIASHVKALDAIYQNTNFNGIRGINFMVKRVRVNGSEEARDPSNPFRFSNIGVEKFLELSSEQNHDEFCLAYVFTDRDFDDGVLGLAWVAAPSGSSGGICERHRLYSDGRKKSLNTGIITVQNYGSSVPPKVSHITLAHEVGHNFGSPHDSGVECTPGTSTFLPLKERGNYIMFARATSGDKSNNNRFSPCSVGNISAVLAAKRTCFTESGKPICGNALVETGEECDCGYSDQCQDQCCHHADSPDNQRCRLRDNVACSPSQGPCCTSSCVFVSGGTACRPESECAYAGWCTGMAATCPASEPKANHTACNNHTQVCVSGQCAGSICERYGLEECSCSQTEDDREMCHLCCMRRGEADSCVSSGSPLLARHFNSSVILLQPGAACNEFRGYCDGFLRCRLVDADGPLARLKKAIFNPELYHDIATWIRVYWWAVLLMFVALILVMAAFIRVCSVHTPTSNPKLPPHKHISETLRRGRRRPPPSQAPPGKRGGGGGAGGGAESVELQGPPRGRPR